MLDECYTVVLELFGAVEHSLNVHSSSQKTYLVKANEIGYWDIYLDRLNRIEDK